MPTVQDLVQAVEAIAPPALAEEWDNVGLLLGDPREELVGPVVLTIDLTEAVLEEALTVKASGVIAYHPPIFKPLKRITADSPKERVVMRAARAGLAIYSPHTALDAAPGGMADWLADATIDPQAKQTADRRALRAFPHLPGTQEVKIVTFVPADKPEVAERVRGALASAGAGIIGEYVSCSFAAAGTGTFLGKPGTAPAVGAPGQMESVRELRLEMVCSRRALPLALTTLRQFHPYEEPAIDVYALEPHPRRDTGAGRRLSLDQPVPLSVLAKRVKARLGVNQVMVAAAGGGDPTVSTVAVCPGDGGQLVDAAVAEGCRAYVTGEMSHHEVWACLNRGLSVILAGHTNTERGYLPILAERLSRLLPAVRWHVAKRDVDPLSAV